jgi:hypothetical protein
VPPNPHAAVPEPVLFQLPHPRLISFYSHLPILESPPCGSSSSARRPSPKMLPSTPSRSYSIASSAGRRSCERRTTLLQSVVARGTYKGRWCYNRWLPELHKGQR